MLTNALNIMYEQYGDQSQSDDGVDPSKTFPEETPLKKYDLLQKTIILRSNLQANGIYDEDLDTIIQFGPDLSYETLLALVNSLVDKLKNTVTSGNKTNGKNTKQS